jgi:hypothetical protein
VSFHSRSGIIGEKKIGKKGKQLGVAYPFEAAQDTQK